MPQTREPDPLLADVEAFLAGTGMSATRFGLDAMGDPGFVHKLRGGREVKIATRKRVVGFMREWRAAKGKRP